MPTDEKQPHPVDLHVGAKVRTRRKVLGLSQETLGSSIGLTFQQVQKYERGANRISASMLLAISNALKVPITYFFDGYSDGTDVETFSESSSEKAVNSFLLTNEGIELAEAFPRIDSARRRRKILDLVRSLAEDDDT